MIFKKDDKFLENMILFSITEVDLMRNRYAAASTLTGNSISSAENTRQISIRTLRLSKRRL